MADKEHGRAPLPYGVKLALLTAAYFAAAKLSLSLALVGDSVTPLWAPAGVALVALLLHGTRMWPAITAGAFLANLSISPSWRVAALIAVGNTLAPLVAHGLLRRWGFRPELTRLRDALSLVPAALLGMLVSASVGATALRLGDDLGAAGFASAWWVWWAGDAAGALLVAPSLLSLRRLSLFHETSWVRRFEAAGVFLALVGVTILALWTDRRLLCLPFPVVIWMTLRFRQGGAAAASVATSGLAIFFASQGAGVFSHDSLLDRMITLQAFSASVALTAFTLAALNLERMAAHVSLMRAGADLQRQVEERTAELDSVVAQLADAQRIAGLGSWEWDVTQDEVVWSDQMYRIFGLEPQASNASYEEFLQRIHPEDRAELDGTVRRSLLSGETFEVRHRVPQRKGEDRVVHGRGASIRDDSGKVVKMVGTAVDITALARAESAVRSSEERLRLVLETANDAFVAIDTAGTICRWNKQAEVIFGWPREEAIGKSLAETIIPPGFRREHKEGLARFMETGETKVSNQRLEVTALHRDGREFPVELTVWPVTVDGDTKFNAFIKDVTERKRQEKELQQRTAELKRSNDELANFAYVASHDLQAPARMVSSYLQLLESRSGDRLDDDGREFVAYARAAAERMCSLIRGLLDYARVDSKKTRTAPVELGEIVEEALADLHGAIAEADADVLVGPLPRVHADPQQMAQLFQNLLSNAIKFCSDEPPRVEIAAERSGRGWVISVADNGIGIDEAFSGRIFGIFQRDVGDEFPGSGIGLSLCKRIVDQHEGRIWFEARPEGGTVFSFSLPVTDRDERETELVLS